MTYQEFLETKRMLNTTEGIPVDHADMHDMLFPFQKDLVKWACRKGRSALFCDTGLGKTFMQVEWSRLIGGKGLIIAPLSVAKQTVREALKLGATVYYTRSGENLS